MREDAAIAAKGDVSLPKLYRAPPFGGVVWVCVLSHPKEVVERNCDEIPDRLGLRSWVVAVCRLDVCDGVDGQREFGLGRRVLVAERLQQVLEGEVELVRSVCLVGITVSGQNRGLGHVPEPLFDGRSADLTSSPEVAFPEPDSKGQEELLLDRSVDPPHVGVLPVVRSLLAPREPVPCPFGVIHRRKGKFSPRNVESTCDVISGVGCTTCQERCFRRGNFGEKISRNCESAR
mmetsp:Transcript_6386/g.18704  ORF Transcript_6386/g.18704 Transcript_6386/m.18704 type:complete len:233 (-) Transcript_6386:4675-5373(-)